jgi:hypothetical protein
VTYTIGTGHARRLTLEGRRVLRRMVEAGMARDAIERHLGCTRETVNRMWRALGKPIRPRNDSADDADILARLRAGQPQAQIVREVRVGFVRVRRVRDAHGIPPLPKRGPRKPEPTQPVRLRDIRLEPIKPEPRPAHWGTPKPAPALKHLAAGRTPWRCGCTTFGVRVTGPTCPQCQTPAPWAELLEAA